MASLVERLRERKLVQWAIAYLAGAWAALEMAAFVAERFGWPEVLLQALTLVAFFGFLATLVLAWYHGELGEQRVSGPELLVLALILVLAGAALSLLDPTATTQRADLITALSALDGRPSVAVLLCENRSPDEQDAYVAGGIHDAIVVRLSKLSGLRSLGRRSVESYENDSRSVLEIASELGVGFLGVCSVRRDPESRRLRLTFQLVDATGAQVWAEQFDPDSRLGDLFDMQSDVARRIAAGVGTQLSPDERVLFDARPTENSEAYDYYLRGQDYWVRPGYRETNWAIAADFWSRAIELDPEFALARAKLSFLHGRTYFFSYDLSQERLAAQAAQAETALRIDPGLPEAHFAQGYVHYVRGDLRAALSEFGIAQDGAPGDAVASAFMGYAYRRLGEWDDWERAYHLTVALNPRDIDIYHNLGALTLSFLHRFEEAVEASNRALEMAPDFDAAAVRRGHSVFRWKGDLSAFHSALLRYEPHEASSLRYDVAMLERDPARALDVIQDGPTLTATQMLVRPLSLQAAWAHRMAGDTLAALEAFKSALVTLDSLYLVTGDFRILEALGHVYAGLGRAEEAASSARRYVEEAPQAAGDIYFGTGLALRETQVLAQAGLVDEAVDRLAELVAGPSQVTVPVLRTHWVWDPLRGSPRFVALVGG